MRRLRLMMLVLFAIAFALNLPAQERTPAPYWEEPEVFAENKLAPRATLIPYTSTDDAIERGESEWVMDISGEWRFHWTKTPAERPEGFWAMDYDDNGWGSIPVPGNWEINGYGAQSRLTATSTIKWVRHNRCVTKRKTAYLPHTASHYCDSQPLVATSVSKWKMR